MGSESPQRLSVKRVHSVKSSENSLNDAIIQPSRTELRDDCSLMFIPVQSVAGTEHTALPLFTSHQAYADSDIGQNKVLVFMQIAFQVRRQKIIIRTSR